MNAISAADEDAVLPVTIGTAVWLIILVALIARKPVLDENGTGWWIGVAVAGFVTGAGGVLYLRWRRARLARARRSIQE